MNNIFSPQTAKIRLVLFTAQDIGFVLTSYFAARSDIDLLVVTHDKPPDSRYGYRSALLLCRQQHIKHIEALRISDKVISAIEQHSPDFILCAYFAKILPYALLQKSRRGAINVHPGKLPFYKGRFPTPWYILNGETTFGVALHDMVEAVDAGNVYVQEEFAISPTMTGHELLVETMKRSADVIIDNFDKVYGGQITARPQMSGGSQYDHIDAEYEIDWTQPAEHINRQIRVHAPPYKPAFGTVESRRIEVRRARVTHDSGRAGTWISASDTLVACGIGALSLEDWSAD